MDVGRTLEGRAVGSGVVNASARNPINRLPRCYAFAFLLNPALLLFLGCAFVRKVLYSYSAVPFFGTKNASVSMPSSLRSMIFLSMPPAYPVRLPFAPTTLWQGMIRETSLCPTAPPTAWADILFEPVSCARRWAISPFPGVLSKLYGETPSPMDAGEG